MLAALLAGLLAVAPAPAATCPEPAPIGPAQAPLQIRWYLDPVMPGAHDFWLESHRLVADYGGDVRIQPILVVNATNSDPHEATTRRWIAAALRLGRADAALRRLDVDGAEALAVRLRASPDALAGELGVAPAALRAALDDPCITRALARGSAELRDAIRRGPGRAGRPPAFIVSDGGVFEDGARLDGVRREIERARRHRRRLPAIPTILPRSVSPRVTRPAADLGLLVGGAALPHRLVLFVEQEDHPNFILLPPALAFRTQRPGELAVQVIARGTSRAATRFRLRLCAARGLGVELEYLRILALDYGVPSPHAADLRERLDAAAERLGCSPDEERLDAVEGAPSGLPEGIWLDGAAVHQREVSAIEREILSIDRATRPLDAVSSAAAPTEP